MTIYLLRQKTVPGQQIRVCAVNAGDKSEAKYRAEMAYGGDWQIMETHPTLEELQHMVEDSSAEAVLMNI